METCAMCGKSKSDSQFAPDGRTKDNLSPVCVDCRFNELETVDIPAVEVLSTGGPVHGQGSPPEGDFWSRSQLEEMAVAARELAGEIKAPNKIGHSDAQSLVRNSELAVPTPGEMPAVGWLDGSTARVVDGEDGVEAVLVMDAKAVPKKFAQLIKAKAYRTRSAELSRVTSQVTQKTYDWVVTGLAWLGAKLPAVQTLDDVVALYASRQLEVADGVRAYVVYAGGERRTQLDFGTVNAADVQLGDAQLQQASAELNVKPSEVAGFVAARLSDYLASLGRQSEFAHAHVPAPPNLGATVSPLAKSLLLARVGGVQQSQTPGSKIQLDLDIVVKQIAAWDPAASSDSRGLELVEAAVADGRISTGERQRWLERMAVNPREYAQMLDERQPDRKLARANALHRTPAQEEAHRVYGAQLKGAFPWL